MVQGRLETDGLFLTHEFMAVMLGVRRAGVTMSLQHFVSKGVIETARGAITVKDRHGLRNVPTAFTVLPRQSSNDCLREQIS
jgi:CRP-like cAMP-binding protein